MTRNIALVFFGGGALTISLTRGVSAGPETKGDLHVTKECSQYTGSPGGFCTITSSNLAAIPVRTKIFYTQAPGIVAGLLDSNIVLDAGAGNRSLGRCTLDFATGLGLCTLSDGTGQLAGLHARVDVSFLGGSDWAWDGEWSLEKGF